MKSDLAALAAEAACTEEGADGEEETTKNETKKRKASELEAAWIAVMKHHRLTKMQTRLDKVSNKKQKTISNADQSGNTTSGGSHNIPVLNGTTQQKEPNELQSEQRNQNPEKHVGANSIEDKNIVSVKGMFESMLSRQTIRVKISYVPAAVTRMPRQYGSKSALDIFETVVGCSGQEYIMFAFHTTNMTINVTTIKIKML